MGLFSSNKEKNKESKKAISLKNELKYNYGIDSSDFKNQNAYIELLSDIELANIIRNTRLKYEDRTTYSEKILANTEFIKISQGIQISKQLEQLIDLNKQILEKDKQILEKLKEKEEKQTSDIVNNVKVDTIKESISKESTISGEEVEI